LCVEAEQLTLKCTTHESLNILSDQFLLSIDCTVVEFIDQVLQANQKKGCSFKPREPS